jgi:hypothetical protein
VEFHFDHNKQRLEKSVDKNEPGKHKFRPERFPIKTAFRYRESGSTLWRHGFTIDISRSGLLFAAERLLPLKTILEMRIGFPSEMTGDAAASLFCCGSVIRCEDAQHDAPPLIAAFFFSYRFTHDNL